MELWVCPVSRSSLEPFGSRHVHLLRTRSTVTWVIARFVVDTLNGVVCTMQVEISACNILFQDKLKTVQQGKCRSTGAAEWYEGNTKSRCRHVQGSNCS